MPQDTKANPFQGYGPPGVIFGSNSVCVTMAMVAESEPGPSTISYSVPGPLPSEMSSNNTVSSNGQDLLHSELDIKFELDEELKQEPQDCSMDYDDNEPAKTDCKIAEALPTSQPNDELPAPQFSRKDKEAITTPELLRVDCCSTDFILNFLTHSKLNSVNKKYVIGIGRARPKIKIDQKRRTGRNGCFRHFHMSLYDKYPWMTGSCKLNKMFCFPCLLFSKSSSVWSQAGFSDIKNLSTSAKRHVQAEKHIQSSLALYDYGNPKIEIPLSNTYVEHNRKVDSNREIMKRFIDTVVLMAKLDLPVHGHNQNCDSNNRGNYVETLSYLSVYDTVLSSHLEQCSDTKNPDFSGLSSDTQSDVINCVASVIRDGIKLEINQARFVSAMIDETPDVREQISAILRYVSDSGVVERFIGFYDVSGSNSDVVTELLFSILEQYNCKDKLVGLSYDGAAVRPGEHEAVQARLLKECPSAVFVPCYAHNLNLILSRYLENDQDLKMFFGSINFIVRFFNESSKRCELLKEIVARELPSASEIHDWHDHSRIVNVIFDCRTDIVQTFKTMLDSRDSSEWDGETLVIAEMLLDKFNDMQFCFLLCVFSDIFGRTDNLFALSQSQQVDIEVANQEIKTFKDWLTQEFKNEFDSIYESVQGLYVSPQHRRLSDNVDIKTLYERLFNDIIIYVTTHIEQRYRPFSRMTYLDLTNKTKYASYQCLFPDEKKSALISKYPGKFDARALKSELMVLSSSPSMNQLDSYELFLRLTSSNLREVFPQTYCLYNLFLTLPVTVTPERSLSLSALKRIHAYVRNTRTEGRLADLALISIEKHVLMKLKGKSNFYDNVFTHFVKKNRELVLEYK